MLLPDSHHLEPSESPKGMGAEGLYSMDSTNGFEYGQADVKRSVETKIIFKKSYVFPVTPIASYPKFMIGLFQRNWIQVGKWLICHERLQMEQEESARLQADRDRVENELLGESFRVQRSWFCLR